MYPISTCPPPRHPRSLRLTRRAAGALGALGALLAVAGCERPASKAGAAPSASSSALASPVQSAAAELRLVAAPPRVGTVRLDRVVRELRIPAPMVGGKPQGSPLELDETLEERIETQAVSEGHASSIAVEYRTAKVVRDGKVREDPRASRRFVVGIKDGMLAVTDAKGAPVTDPLAAVVNADHVSLDAAFPLAPYLPDRPLTPGTLIEPSHDTALALFGSTGDFDVKALALTFEGVEGRGAAARAVFGVTARFRVDLEGRTVDLDLTGKARAEVPTGRLRILELAGTAAAVPVAPSDAPARGRAKVTLTSDDG